MIGIELRDEEYNELIDYAKEIVEEADEVKSKACMVIKRLSMLDEDDEDEDEMEEENGPMYRGGRSGSSAAYRKSRIRRMRKRMR